MITPSQIILFAGSNPELAGLLCIVSRSESYVVTLDSNVADELYRWLYKGGYAEYTVTALDGTEVELINSPTRRLRWANVELVPMRDKKRLGKSVSDANADPFLQQIMVMNGGSTNMGTIRPDIDME